jgi:hypothetical protein
MDMSTTSLYVADLIFKEVVRIAVPKTIDLGKKCLAMFASGMNGSDSALPSAALIGLGHCGTNICIEVARQLKEVIAATRENAAPREGLAYQFLRRFGGSPARANPYLFQPVIMLADADNRGAEIDQHSASELIVPGYQRCRRIDLNPYEKNGCGNIPQVGQYLARVILGTLVPDEPTPTTDALKFSSWTTARSYLLDTVGLEENSARLMVYVFSTGGGTGSGFSTELGAAQRFLLLKRTADAVTGVLKERLHLESFFSLGLAVMPAHDGLDAQLLNTGRLLVSFLSRLQRYRRTSPGKRELSELDVPPFDCQLLVSNDIMGPLVAQKNAPFEAAVRAANVYISQHLFNILLAQSLPSDLASGSQDDEGRQKLMKALRDGGLEGGELGSFDAGDLKNSLYGLSVVGYAESKRLQDLDVERLIVSAVGAPAWNAETDSIDGISVLPLADADYATRFTDDPGATIRNLAESVPLFARAYSVVAAISVPTTKEGVLKAHHVKALKRAVAQLFPKAAVRRYVVIPDSGEMITLGVFICGNGFMTHDAMRAIYAYGVNCFATPGRESELIDSMDAYLRRPEPEEYGAAEEDCAEIRQLLRSQESMGSVIAGLGDDGAFLQKRLELEARSIESGERREFADVLLSSADFIDALRFMRDGFAFRGLIQPKESTALIMARDGESA